MLSIGEFAQVTGLTIKALRHYDERGLIRPIRVDPLTRHRSYGSAQLGDAVLVAALRAAEVPLERVRAALASSSDARAVLTGFRSEVTAARAAQDEALAAAEVLVDALADPAPVVERNAHAQPWAGVELRVPAYDDPEYVAGADAALSRAARRLRAELERTGAQPQHPMWTSMEADDDGAALLRLCWPLSASAPDGLPAEIEGLPVRTGTLPARRELVARWDRGEDLTTRHGLPHPAMISLLQGLSARDAAGAPDPMTGTGSLRQAVWPGEGPDGSATVELTVALGAPVRLP
ncbi:MerR family transcriptional regulator [Pseudonocardia alni]|uniref:MerR family transcriptional regulator n=1 Tax=Pseudonocardia alni TaxID=33907 RepID=UPI0033F02249